MKRKKGNVARGIVERRRREGGDVTISTLMVQIQKCQKTLLENITTEVGSLHQHLILMPVGLMIHELEGMQRGQKGIAGNAIMWMAEALIMKVMRVLFHML